MTAEIINCKWLMEAARLDDKPREVRSAEVRAFPAEAMVRVPVEFLSLHRIAKLTSEPAKFARMMERDGTMRGAYALTSASVDQFSIQRAELWGRYADMVEARAPAAWQARRAQRLKNSLIA